MVAVEPCLSILLLEEGLCLGSDHNPALAGPGFPSEQVFYADKSYAAAASGLLDCADLLAALATTYA